MKRNIILLISSILILAIVLSSCSFTDATVNLLTRGAKDSDMDLLQSISNGNSEASIEAMKKGADKNHLSGSLNERTDHGIAEKNPYRIACFLRKYNVATCLIENGADANYMDSDGYPVLAYTVCSNNLKLCSLLLKHGADINKTGRNGYTALDCLLAQWPISDNDTIIDNTMTYLIEHGAGVNSKTVAAAMKGLNNDGYCKYTIVHKVVKKCLESGQKSNISPVLEAAVMGNNEKVKELISSGQIPQSDEKKVLFYTAAYGNTENFNLLLKKGLSINMTDAKGNTLLTIAAKSGNADMVKYLILSGLNIETANYESLTPLDSAVSNDQYITARILLSAGAKVTPHPAGYRVDPLSNASRNGNLDMVKLLINNGYPKNNMGMALCMAAEYNRTDVIKYLIGAGVNPDSEFNQETALGHACSYENVQTIKTLLDNGASVNGGTIKGEPLNVACLYGEPETSEILVNKGANVNLVYTCKDGSITDPPLWKAVESGSLDIVRLLVEHGADINYKDKAGATILIHASMFGSKSVLEYLLQKGADVNARDSEGKTALITAAGSGYTDNVKILLKYHADKNIKDNSGNTAATTKKSKNDSQIRKILTEFK